MKRESKRTNNGICKRMICMLMMAALLLAGTVKTAQPVQAAAYSWMQSARNISLNSTVSGYARNNQTPTYMDPYYSYDEYFYIYLPVSMQINLCVAVNGTQPFDQVYIHNGNGDLVTTFYDFSWSYDRNANTSFIERNVNLNAGTYYIHLSDIYKTNTESHPYALRVKGKLLTTMYLTYAQKASATSARIDWSGIRGVSGYEIFRKTSGGKYVKIGTVSGNSTACINYGLSRNRKYSYKVRAYVVVNNVKIYSACSNVKSVRI